MKNLILSLMLVFGVVGCGKKAVVEIGPGGRAAIDPPTAPEEKWVSPDVGLPLFISQTKIVFGSTTHFTLASTSERNSTPLTVNQADYKISEGRKLRKKFTHQRMLSQGHVVVSAQEASEKKAPFCALAVNATPENLKQWKEKNILEETFLKNGEVTDIRFRPGMELLLESGISYAVVPDYFLNMTIEYHHREGVNYPGMLFYCGYYHPKILMSNEVSPLPQLKYEDAMSAISTWATFRVRASGE